MNVAEALIFAAHACTGPIVIIQVFVNEARRRYSCSPFLIFEGSGHASLEMAT